MHNHKKMKDFKLLDCTLRDGGYYNNWDFDQETVEIYLNALVAASIDIVEIGFRSLPKKSFKGPYIYSQDDYIETLEMLDSAESTHVGYEINISCPNVKEGGMEFGVSPEMTEKLTKELRLRTEKILIMKLSPNVTSIADIGLAAQRGGADAVSAINTIMGMSVDINTRRPRLSTTMGGLSGPCIKPVALANVYKLYKDLEIPIIGIGGISSCNDVIEFISAGASFIQLGTINYKYPNLVESLTGELENYLKDQNHNFDLIIADLHLEGEKSGEQVVTFLKDMDVKYDQTTPVLFFSASTGLLAP